MMFSLQLSHTNDLVSVHPRSFGKDLHIERLGHLPVLCVTRHCDRDLWGLSWHARSPRLRDRLVRRAGVLDSLVDGREDIAGDALLSVELLHQRDVRSLQLGDPCCKIGLVRHRNLRCPINHILGRRFPVYPLWITGMTLRLLDHSSSSTAQLAFLPETQTMPSSRTTGVVKKAER